MTNKERFLQYADWRKKKKEYARRALESDLTSINIRSIEKTSGRKYGQITRR